MRTSYCPRRERYYPSVPEFVPGARTLASLRPGPVNGVEGGGLEAFLARAGLEVPRADDDEPPQMVSSSDGFVDTLLLAIPEYAVAPVPGDARPNPLASWYRTFFAALPPELTIVVVTHARVSDEVASWLAGHAQSRIIEAVDDLNFSIWVEDTSAVLNGRGGPRFVRPGGEGRFGDWIVPELVSRALCLPLPCTAPLSFQGGNLLVGDDFCFLGLDSANHTYTQPWRVLRDRGDRAHQIARELRRHLAGDKAIYFIGTEDVQPPEEQIRWMAGTHGWDELLHAGSPAGTRQPIFHLDMFLTLAGRTPEGKRRVVIGKPDLPELADFAVSGVADVECRALDEIALRIAAFDGFEVVRTPLPLVYIDDLARRRRSWFFASYNNALVEWTAERARIWLPTYGSDTWPELRDVDARVARQWQELGFEVRQVPDMLPFAECLGALHCLKKVLRRRPAA